MGDFGKHMQAAFLYLLRENPTLLPAAPTDYTARDIDHRRLDEVHACLSCGRQAQCSYVADTTIGPRWLDLCPPCTRLLMYA